MRILATTVLALLLLTSGCDKPADAAGEQPKLQLKSKQSISLGLFQISRPQVAVCDPSYDLATVNIPGLGAILDNCQTGSWQAYVVMKEFVSRNYSITSELLTWHQSITNESELTWVKQDKEIGADTGQIGVFDLQHYEDDSIVPANYKWTQGENGAPIDKDNLWYSLCCEITDLKKTAGVMPFGTISRSGYGDGGYYYFIARNTEGKIIGIKIIFVNDQGQG